MSTNSRASLLAGLRTGGVRSASGTAVPHTAAPGASFQIPRFVSSSHPAANNANNHYQDEEADYVAETLGQTLNFHPARRTTIPLTASAADAGVPKFQQQQQFQQQNFLRQAANQRATANNQQQQHAFLNQMQQMAPQAQAQAQAQLMQLWQMQQMQMQMMLAQQQQYQPEPQRPSVSGLRAPGRQQIPSTAGPLQTSFNISQPTRTRVQVEQALSDDPGPVPMTAALGGKFGSRSLPAGLNGGFSSDDDYKNIPIPQSAGYQHTTVISGGTSLGTAGGAVPHSPMTVTPSKSDSAISWRRNNVNNSVLRNTPLRAATLANPPTVTISSPNGEDIDGSDQAPPAHTPIRTRPQPLHFALSTVNARQAPTVTLDVTGSDGNLTQTIAINGTSIAGDGSSSPSSGSLPPTPPSATSVSSLSAREEASKKLYEGLGIGRPAPVAPQLQPQHQSMQYGSPNSMSIVAAAVAARAVSQPLRQPRGPPSTTEDFGQKNFASRIRRQAIGGLGALMGARERRDGGVEVEAY